MAQDRSRFQCRRLLPLLGLALVPGMASARAVVRSHVDSGGWRLTIAEERFSAAVRCTLHLRNGRARYRPGAVGFRFTRQASVAGAVIRFDDGPPIAYRDLLPELARHNVAIGGEEVVWVPFNRLEGVHHLWIAPQFGVRPRHFLLDGLGEALVHARDRGCVGEGQFG